MLAKTHGLVAFSALAGVAVYTGTKNVGTSTIVVCLIFNTVGSLLPDIDQASNRLWDLLPGGETIGRWLGVLMRHRGISHSLLGLFLADKFLFWLIARIFNGEYLNIYLIYWSVIIGYISHLIADSFTEEGVPLLYPIKVNLGLPPVKIWRIKTGRWFEKLIVIPGVTISLVYFCATSWNKILEVF
jgi:membrane-bound metal-dependent hydrolase YbcI (DUF457 family)